MTRRAKHSESTTSAENAGRKTREAAWLADNRDAIDAYNDFVATHSLFSDGRRRF